MISNLPKHAMGVAALGNYVAGILGVVSLVGYMTDHEALYAWHGWTAMAPNTAASFAFAGLSTGYLLMLAYRHYRD